MLFGPSSAAISPPALPPASPAAPSAPAITASATQYPTTFSGLVDQQRNAILGGAAAGEEDLPEGQGNPANDFLLAGPAGIPMPENPWLTNDLQRNPDHNVSPALPFPVRINDLNVSHEIVDYLASRGMPGGITGSPESELAHEIVQALSEGDVLDAIFFIESYQLNVLLMRTVPVMALSTALQAYRHLVPPELQQQRVDLVELMTRVDHSRWHNPDVRKG